MIEFSHVYKSFGEKEVFHDVSFSIEKGEIFTFIGPSGTGKTTILRLINLLERPSSGQISFEGQDTGTSERDRLEMRRRMSMVFQKPVAIKGNVLYNVALGLRFRKISGDEVTTRIVEALDLVGLPDIGTRNARTLSGGEMQRLAIARAIVTKPEVLLLDEPTANLDPVSTEKIESLITAINEKFGTTIILSTHDMVQGQRLATMMAVVLNRTIGQIGTSHEIFYQPQNRDVAHMVGADNILEGIVVSNESGLATIDVSGITIMAITPAPPGQKVTVYMRPEDIVFSTTSIGPSSARNLQKGRIVKVTPMGPMIRVKVDSGLHLTAIITKRSYDELELGPGREVYLSFKASAMHVVPE